MRRASILAALLAVAGVRALAQEPAPVYQTQKQKSFRFTGDALVRYEWTRDIPPEIDKSPNESRWRLQARPRAELSLGPAELGLGGDFNYSQDENDKAPTGQTLSIVRDNYRSRDARLDLYYAKVTLGPVTAQGGRFVMPIALTEMMWDRDLRPQGGALTIAIGEATAATRIALTGLYATRSQVFEDKSRTFAGSLELSFRTGAQSRLELIGSYLDFRDLDTLSPVIRRQNTRVAGLIAGKYRVVDGVGRIRAGGQMPFQLVADYCWNTAADTGNKGLWLAAVLGSFDTSRARAEYTYSKIDRDATVAAFNADDFYWGTGWEGHRGDLGVSMGRGNSFHGIAQWQRFKDGATPAIREQWVKRFRVEYRYIF
jgi:hypothetical protein